MAWLLHLLRARRNRSCTAGEPQLSPGFKPRLSPGIGGAFFNPLFVSFALHPTVPASEREVQGQRSGQWADNCPADCYIASTDSTKSPIASANSTIRQVDRPPIRGMVLLAAAGTLRLIRSGSGDAPNGADWTFQTKLVLRAGLLPAPSLPSGHPSGSAPVSPSVPPPMETALPCQGGVDLGDSRGKLIGTVRASRRATHFSSSTPLLNPLRFGWARFPSEASRA